jgi:hypothetical protein
MNVQQLKDNSYRFNEQVQSIGNQNPPDMSKIPDSLLKKASPDSFNLLNLKIDTKSSDAAKRACTEYKDVNGLRRLQKGSLNKTFYEPGCGWTYKPSSGIVPEVNQGAFGTSEGPSQGNQGNTNGVKWYWDLNTAEKEISQEICSKATKCKHLRLLGANSETCGYCKTTDRVIPVVRTIAGTYEARYKTDANLSCRPADIVTVASPSGSCPPTDGFANFTGSTSLPRNGRGDLREAFRSSHVRREEGFTLDDLDQCTSPLSRECVILAARTAGCSDEGTLISALKASKGGDYDSVLKENPVYTSYKSVASPGITSATLKDGSVTIDTALDDFGTLMRNTNTWDLKKHYSAYDLCFQKGYFDKYDFCSEMRAETVISKDNIKCVQDFWLKSGGTRAGRGYPTLEKWSGKRYKILQEYVTKLQNDIKKTSEGFTTVQQKNMNSASILEFIGTDTTYVMPTNNLPMNPDTCGAETIWIDLVNVADAASIPIILRSDIRLRKDSQEIMPWFSNASELVNKYRLYKSDNIAYMCAFEFRSLTRFQFDFQLAMIVDDGFMIGVGKPPLTNGNSDWGSWAYQGPTRYESKMYTSSADKPMPIIKKFFQGYGGATSLFYVKTDQWRMAPYTDVYLTQDPLAPWMKYEVYPSYKTGQLGLHSTRFDGPSALSNQNTQMPSFETESAAVAYQTDPRLLVGVPKNMKYSSFGSSSWWHTQSHFHVNAFKTITILIRPKATLANGAEVNVFFHTNLRTFRFGCYLINNGGTYQLRFAYSSGDDTSYSTTTEDVSVSINEWNLLVFQYVGNANGLIRVNMFTESLTNLKNEATGKSFINRLKGRQGGGKVILGSPGSNNQTSSGWLMLGSTGPSYYYKPGMWGWNNTGFTGDVAWIHGFRDYFTSYEMLTAEINQSWLSRW